MRLHRKSVTLLIVLGLASTYLTIYTATVHSAACYVSDLNGTVLWSSAPSGSFFPWPTPPGMLEILSGMNQADLFIYTYLIKPWTLAGATVLLWTIWLIYLLKLFKNSRSRDEPDQKRRTEQEKPKEEEDRVDLQELQKRFEIPPPG